MLRKIFISLILLLLLITVFAAGAFFQSRSLGRQDAWIDIQKIFQQYEITEVVPTNDPNALVQGDALNRLIKYPNKQEVACPAQTDQTMVLFIAGQSNSANHGGQRFASAYGDRVLNYSDGKCYIAQSPLLGASGLEGESWTRLGNLLIENNLADRVIISSNGIGGSEIAQWRSGTPYYQMLRANLKQLLSQYQVTQMLWHQGETDYAKNTSQKNYEQGMRDLIKELRSNGLNAPIYVSNTSRCWDDGSWSAVNPVTLAQKALVDSSKQINAGVDSDALMGELDRFDNCHFSGSGQEKFAQAWLGILRNSPKI